MKPNLHMAKLKPFMIISGIWPLEFLSDNFIKFVYRFYSQANHIYFGIFILAQYIKIYTIIESDMVAVADIVGVVIIYTSSLIKLRIMRTERFLSLFRFIYKRETFILNQSGSDTKHIYLDYADTGRKLNWYYILLTLFVGFLYNVKSYFKCFVDYDSNSDEPRPLPINLWIPSAFDKNYVVSFIFALLGVELGPIFNIIQNSIVINLLLFVVGHLKILQSEFTKALNVTNNSLMEDEIAIKKCIIHHISILKFTYVLNDLIKYPLLLDFLIGSFQISMMLFQLMTTPLDDASTPFTLLFLVMIVSTMFILNWYANEIQYQHSVLDHSIYNSLWYSKNAKIRKLLVYTMFRSQKPVNLTLGPFFAISNVTSITVLKAAYSYCTLMIRAYE